MRSKSPAECRHHALVLSLGYVDLAIASHIGMRSLVGFAHHLVSDDVADGDMILLDERQHVVDGAENLVMSQWLLQRIALKLDADSKLVAVFPARQPRPSGMEGDHLGLTHDVSRSVGINHDVRAHPFLLGSEHTQRPFNSRFGGVMQNNSLHIVHFVP